MRAIEIFEGRESPLYHFTLSSNIVNIMRENSLGVQDKFDQEYVSLTRNPRHFMTTERDIVLIFNQRKLSHNHSFDVHYGDIIFHHPGKPSEAEERIWKKITPLSKYLDGIVLDFDYAYDYQNMYEEEIDFIKLWCEQHNIPLYVSLISSPTWHKKLQLYKDFQFEISKANRINESKLAPLYHGTTMTNAVKILQTRHFKSGRGYKINGKIVQGISTTRSKSLNYSSGRAKAADVVFVLNQDFITKNYSIKPYDFNATHPESANILKVNRRDEAEEVIITNELPTKAIDEIIIRDKFYDDWKIYIENNQELIQEVGDPYANNLKLLTLNAKHQNIKLLNKR